MSPTNRQRLRRLVGFLRQGRQYLAWTLSKTSIPVNGDGSVRIHVGCGDVVAAGFINVDARPLPHVHFVKHDISSLPMFSNEYADLVYMCHVLEHVTHLELPKVLAEARRILKPGGVLRLSVPDFERILEIYRATGNSIPEIEQPLMGGQAYGENFHRSVFNERHLTGLLLAAGFSSTRPWSPERCKYHDFEDWASRPLVVGGKAYPISLNIEAVR